jgi:endogenous inhibitor of DNA gyrase (YacG/DUF329 family)
MCPMCGIFFEKNRKDQEYCSARCQQTMAGAVGVLVLEALCK